MAAVVADEQPFEVVQPGEGALDNPADATEAGTMVGVATCDLGAHTSQSQLAPVLVVVVASVGEHTVRPFAGPADLAAHRRYPFDQGDELGDVVAVAAGDAPGERDPGRVYEKVMLGAVSGSINRARARRGAPFFACT